MEIIIKGGDPTAWYSSHVGFKYKILAKPNGTDYYLVDKPNHGMLMVNKNDCEEVLFCDEVKKHDAHYENNNGSLYKFAEDHGLNSYEFDIIKRITRCRKKGQFKEDLEKTKRVIDIYLEEHVTGDN
jgi:hypothetical protein